MATLVDPVLRNSEPAADDRVWPTVLIGVVTFNSAAVIARAIDAILAQDYAPVNVMVCDNASTDGTAAIVEERYPWVTLVVLPENRGPNPSRNRIVAAAGEDGLALILDDDCFVTPGMLHRLVEAAQAHPEGGGFGARVVYDREPERIQFDGVLVHYVGEAVQRNAMRLVHEVDDTTVQVGGLGGGCQLIRARAWRAVGGFDETLFFGREDGELTQRLAIAGYPSFVVPTAVVRHAVEPRGLAASLYQIRNRWLVILALYRARTLLLIAPALLLHELVLAGFMLTKGGFGVYCRALVAVLRGLPAVWAKRRRVQALRRAPDRAYLGVGPIAVREDVMRAGGWQWRVKTTLDLFYERYWRLVGRFV